MASLMKREWTSPTGKRTVAWQVQYLVKGKKRRRQFKVKAKAQRFLETVSEQRKRDVAAGIAACPTPLSDWMQTWLRGRETGSDGFPPIEPETAVWYRGLIANHISPVLGRLPIGELRRQHVKQFREQLVEDGALSRRTVKKVMTALRTILQRAVEDDLLPSNPAHGIGMRLSARDKKEIEIHTIAEMTAILEAAGEAAAAPDRQGKSWSRYYPMLLLLVYGGFRISEVRGLDVKDVDLSRVVVRVNQRADRRGRIGLPKSRNGFREVHLPQVLEPELRRVINGRTNGLMFKTASGRPVDPANFRKRAWEHIQKRAGTRVMTLHSCRHFYASRQIAQGINPKELAELLGHADEAFTLKTYGHLFRDHESEKRRQQRADALILTPPLAVGRSCLVET